MTKKIMNEKVINKTLDFLKTPQGQTLLNRAVQNTVIQRRMNQLEGEK